MLYQPCKICKDDMFVKGNCIGKPLENHKEVKEAPIHTGIPVCKICGMNGDDIIEAGRDIDDYPFIKSMHKICKCGHKVSKHTLGGYCGVCKEGCGDEFKKLLQSTPITTKSEKEDEKEV